MSYFTKFLRGLHCTFRFLYEKNVCIDDFGKVSNFQGAFTFEAWVLNDGTNNWGRIFDFGDSTGEYIFFTPQSSTGFPTFVFKPAGSPEYIIQPNSVFPTGWTHVACRLDAAGNATLLYNGVEVGSSSGWPSPSSIASPSSSKFDEEGNQGTSPEWSPSTSSAHFLETSPSCPSSHPPPPASSEYPPFPPPQPHSISHKKSTHSHSSGFNLSDLVKLFAMHYTQV